MFTLKDVSITITPTLDLNLKRILHIVPTLICNDHHSIIFTIIFTIFTLCSALNTT